MSLLDGLTADWTDGRITLKWECDHVATIRCHKTDQIPGPVEWTCIAVVNGNKYEYKLLEPHKEGRAPTGSEYKRVSRYLDSLFNAEGGHRRFKEGKRPKGVGVFKEAD